MDAEDLGVGEECDSDSQCLRWATDPDGRTFRVEVEVPGRFEGPMFEPDGDEGPLLRFMLWRANRLIRHGVERGERRHQGPPRCYLEVWRVSPDEEELAFEQTCLGMEEGRRRGAELVAEIRAGTFAP